MPAGLLAAATAGVYVLIARSHGALGASRNDDWAYYRMSFRLANEGVLELNGWAQMMFVGHAILAWPIVVLFGPDITALQLMVCSVGAVGLWAAHQIVRSFLPRHWSIFATGCLAIGPVYGSLSVSFMTDVPAFTLQSLSLLAGLRALRSANTSVPWFAVSLILGFAAFSIREYSLAAGLSVSCVVIVNAWRRNARYARPFFAMAAGWLAACVSLYVWRSTLSNSIVTSLDLTPRALAGSLRTTWRAALTLGLFVAPAVAVAAPGKLLVSVWIRARTGAAIVILASVAATTLSRATYIGNYFTIHGSYPVTLPGSSPTVVSRPIWWVLQIVSVLSTTALILHVLMWWTDRRSVPSPHPEPSKNNSPLPPGWVLTAVFVAWTLVIALGVVIGTDSPFFDRYLIVIVPFVAALAIRTALDRQLLGRTTRFVALAALGGLGVLGFTIVDAAATFDGAKWRLAQDVERMGYEASTIDGGFEWFAFHQPDNISSSTQPPGTSIWITMFSDRLVCVTSAFEETDEDGDVSNHGQLVQHIWAVSSTGVDYRLLALAGPDSC